MNFNVIQSKRARTSTVEIVLRMKIRNVLNRGKEELNGLSCHIVIKVLGKTAEGKIVQAIYVCVAMIE